MWENFQQTSLNSLLITYYLLRTTTESALWECARMQEYIDNGTCLGWLINRKNKQVEIYRQGKEVEVVTTSQSLSEESILPTFKLDLAPIW